MQRSWVDAELTGRLEVDVGRGLATLDFLRGDACLEQVGEVGRGEHGVDEGPVRRRRESEPKGAGEPPHRVGGALDER